MSIKDKKRILMDYYRKNGGLPKGKATVKGIKKIQKQTGKSPL